MGCWLLAAPWWVQIEKMGITVHSVAGTYIYKTDLKSTFVKVQLWGAGGGSGHFKDRKAGCGGGGAYVEALVNLNPYEILEIQVVRYQYS
jgi:hypothetical protein